MMKIVEPLCIEAETARSRRPKHTRIVRVGFRHQPVLSSRPLFPFSYRRIQLIPDAYSVPVEHLMDSVQTQAVDVILFCPVKDIARGKIAYPARPRAVEIHGLAPGGQVVGREIGAVG